MGNSDTHRTLHQLFNNNDLDAMDAHLREDMTTHDHPRGRSFRSREEFKSWLAAWKTSLPDVRVEDGTYRERQNASIATFYGRGVNDGPLGGLPATGRSVDLPVCEILVFDSDGKVESGEVYYDTMTILVQLGHMQPPG